MSRLRKDFAMVPACAIKELDAGTLNVYIALCLRADSKTAQCYPSYARICEDTSLSRSTVQRGIQKLTELGWITKVRRGSNLTQKANTYKVNNAPQLVNTTTGEILDRFTHEPSLGSPVAKARFTNEPLTNHNKPPNKPLSSFNKLEGEEFVPSKVASFVPAQSLSDKARLSGEDPDFD